MKKIIGLIVAFSFAVIALPVEADNYSLTAGCTFAVPASGTAPVVVPAGDFEWRVNGGTATPVYDQPSCAFAVASFTANPGDVVEVRGREKNNCGASCSSGNGTFTSWSNWVAANAPLPAGLDLSGSGVPTGFSISVIHQ
jgi:hypothetical protein